jgi:hypothetical protein
VVAGLLAIGMFAQQPIVNTILAQWTSKRRRSLSYGTKCLLTFGLGALGVRILGQALNGTVAGYDSGTRTLTVTVKEDAQVVDKSLTLAKDAKVEGDLVAGARVAVTLSVHDKDVAAAVRVLKE